MSTKTNQKKKIYSRTKMIRVVTKAMCNAGKVLNMKIVAINKISGKLKVWCFKIPHYT